VPPGPHLDIGSAAAPAGRFLGVALRRKDLERISGDFATLTDSASSLIFEVSVSLWRMQPPLMLLPSYPVDWVDWPPCPAMSTQDWINST
jgi:hypothetical protein